MVCLRREEERKDKGEGGDGGMEARLVVAKQTNSIELLLSLQHRSSSSS